MIPSKFDTDIETKRQHLDKFYELIKDQLEYGATKYGVLNPNAKREATDIVVEAWGQEWVLGTMNKYLYRFAQKQLEKDLLKIATYAYILWLKNGFHLVDKHLTDTYNEKQTTT